MTEREGGWEGETETKRTDRRETDRQTQQKETQKERGGRERQRETGLQASVVTGVASFRCRV